MVDPEAGDSKDCWRIQSGALEAIYHRTLCVSLRMHVQRDGACTTQWKRRKTNQQKCTMIGACLIFADVSYFEGELFRTPPMTVHFWVGWTNRQRGRFTTLPSFFSFRLYTKNLVFLPCKLVWSTRNKLQDWPAVAGRLLIRPIPAQLTGKALFQ